MTDPVSRVGFRVDDEGILLPAGFKGSVDVFFNDHHAWSFGHGRGRQRRDGLMVPWPARMRSFLDGAARVRLVAGGEELWCGNAVLGSGEGRIDFLDAQGVPVMIDKWGLLQRPFSGRDRGAIEQMVEVSERIIEVMRDRCGLQAWIAFGTLLGAAREGGVIGHDSDIDLAYLSHMETPAEMVTELHTVARVLRGAGLDVVDKSGSFITVVFPGPDGAQASIDVYTCFHVGDLLHETATVRAPVPVSAIEPVTTLEFEGRRLPAPADPDRMLTVSYGPRWRVPDPSFKHAPGPEITERFGHWFGNLMRHRREWETWVSERVEAAAAGHVHADYVDWVLSGSGSEDRVIEIGCGTAGDAVAMARAGRSVLALDYARSIRLPVLGSAGEERLPLAFKLLNLYDLRDTLTRGAFIARDQRIGRRAVAARDLLETLDVDGQEAFWSLASMSLRGGGRIFLEGLAASPADLPRDGGGHRRSLNPRSLERQAARVGGRVVERHGFEAAEAAVRGAGEGPVRWRMMVECPARG